MHRRASERREREPADDPDAPRIPHMLPSRAADRGAAGLLGLLASHADKQLPLLDQRELLRRRHQLPGHARPVMSLEAAASAMHPAALQRHEDFQEHQRPRSFSSSSDKFIDDKALLSSPLVAFLGSTRLPDNVTSPRSVWEANSPNERLDPTASPRHTVAATTRLVPTPPTTSSWRIHNLLSPDPSANSPTRSSRKRRSPPSSPSQQEDATKRPRLVRRVSSQWRRELAPQDRAKTRERIMRSLHTHCQGDYETLLLLLSSMDEELLHIKTTSSEVYAQQAFELGDLIEHATLEH
jgi:hypothetical protein